jgi:hypothetical protein
MGREKGGEGRGTARGGRGNWSGGGMRFIQRRWDGGIGKGGGWILCIEEGGEE